jgi:glycogen debranching enzyme
MKADHADELLDDAGIVERCAEESLRLLSRNLTAAGILAATRSEAADARSYTRIFGRDAGVCVLAMAGSGIPELEQGAVASVESLSALQAPNGQIPKYVHPEGRDADFWYLGCIDATLWWLIAVDCIRRRSPLAADRTRWQGSVEKAIQWLMAQEHQRFFLLQQNEASDWADIMPRSGFVLYTNALWYHVKGLYSLRERDATLHHVNHLFHPFSSDVPEYRRARLLRHYAVRGKGDYKLYLSYVNLAFAGDEGDVFGNVLAILCELAGETRANEILDTLTAAGVADPWPVRVVTHPIARESPRWRAYMARHRQNHPHQYHNGGIWPMVGGFWTAALAEQGRQEQARRALASLARANAAGGWRFTEWFHGQTLEPMGMAGQTWNAAAFLLAKQTVEQGRRPFSWRHE